MRRYFAMFMVGAMTLALSAGCGENNEQSTELRARNLKTGEIHTFSAESDVPDGYAVCADEDCSVPEQVPCDLLGAEVCQYQPNCRIKVISCTTKSGNVAVGCAEPAPAPGDPDTSKPEGDPLPNQTEPNTCVLPDETEVCQVACIPKDYQLCNEITDAQSCTSRPECEWFVADCAMCACPDNGTECDCPPCNTNNGFCGERPTTSCEQIADQSACLSNPACGWGDTVCSTCACGCACPAGDPNCECPPCKCDETCEQGCFTKPDPLCEGLGSEQSCLANPSCEWGQFECPPCVFEEPQNNGSDPSGAPMPPCDCGLSCRTKRYECPPVPAIAMECPDGQQPVPEYDPMGCLIGWKCTSDPICPPMPMYYPVCEDGTEPRPIFDGQGCQFGWECGERLCSSSADCPAGFQCVFNGGAAPGSSGGASDIAAQGQCVACAPVMCEMYCQYGFARDENGCELCSCNPNPNTTCKRTGCSSQICASEDMPSTCEWIDYYQCFDLAVCGMDSTGSCGWIATPEYTQCMTDLGQQP